MRPGEPMSADDASPTDADTGAAAPEPGYDPARQARTLLRTVRSGALATLSPEGHPFASLVTVASLPDGSPVLPLSTLAAHTQHLLADPRCSLLLDGGGKGDPLAHPRLTLTARAAMATPEERVAWRTRFLRRHPKAELYVDFGDFSFWTLRIESARLIGGFGRINTLEGAALLTDLSGAEDLVAAEPRSVDHMNADHRDAIRSYATALCGAPDGDWRIVALDPEGIDLGWQDSTLRLPFPDRITDAKALRRQLVLWATGSGPAAP